MNPRRTISNVSFRTKVLVPMIIVMALLVAVMVFIVNRRITQQFLVEAKNNLAVANAIFLNSQQIYQRELLSRFGNLPNQPLYRSLFFVGHDSPTLKKNFHELLNEPGVDIVFYATNATGIVATDKRDPAISTSAFQAAAAHAVTQALQGEESADIIRASGKLYNIVSLPVNLDGEVIGVLTIGSEIGNADAVKFSQLTHAQIAFFVSGQIIASTLPGFDANNLTAPFKNIILDAEKNSTSGIKQISLGNEHYFGIAGKFPSLNGDASLGYVLLSSYEDSQRALQGTQQLLLLASLCAILISATVIWFLINKVTRPLRDLRDSAEAVGRGDFSRRVPVRSKDECGELAGVFNRMTENLQQSRVQLEKTVETLKTTQEQLIQSEKLSAVGEFVAGVAHELNNPLAAVMGFSEMLKKTDESEKNRRYLDMIFKSAQRCQKIVQSLLSFARRHKPERKPVVIKNLVESVLEIVAYPLRTSNIELTTQFDPVSPVVLADEHQLQQVLINIINNARQAIESHPSQKQAQIKIITEISGDSASIVIRDNGPGIPEENLRKIFDPFFTTKEIGKGTGLGLSLCYGIIREHGGTITPSNVSGGGAQFTIKLPAMQMTVEAAEKPLQKTNGKSCEGVGKKVLVIDDEEILLEMLREELTAIGYAVDTAIDGKMALNQIHKNRYDAFICDWKMPGLNGRAIYEELRKNNASLCRRMIFITGDVVNEPMQQFLEWESLPCLAKPFTLEEIRHTIKSVAAI